MTSFCFKKKQKGKSYYARTSDLERPVYAFQATNGQARRKMKEKKSFVLFTLFFITALYTPLLFPRKKVLDVISEGKLFSFRHYPKFFGDINTRYGNIAERSYLLTNMGKFRNRMYNKGVYLDATLFQFLGCNTRGGACQERLRYNGNAEYWLILDSAKIGAWSRGAFMLHAETNWTKCDSINDDVGSLLAANSRSRVPVPEEEKTTLSEVVLEQVFTDNFLLRLGKLDATGPIDGTDFANNGRFQFLYAGLVNNPMISHFTAYTSLALLPIWKLTNRHALMASIADAQGTADKSGFDTAFNGETTYCIQYVFSPVVNKKPGNYRIIYAHSTKPLTSYELDERHLIGQEIGTIKIPKKCSNHAVLLNFDQYIWVHDKNENIKYRHHRPPIGILLFGRAGWEPEDRNTIDQFYSIGIGGYGGPYNRYYDQWGIGYCATHISCSLRKDLQEKGICFRKFEHAAEAFYNIQLTPSLHFTINAQAIRPPLSTRCTAFLFNARLQTDF